MIIVKLQGGLGNQMFEYAFGRFVQEMTNQRMILDISDFAYDENRNYSLNHFVLGENVEIDDSGKFNKKYDQRENKLIHFGVRVCPQILYMIKTIKNVYIWDYVRFKKVHIKNTNKDIYLHGYWQGYDYFESIIAIIQNEFEVKEQINPENLELYKQITETESVCVHIRRGDFLLASNKLYNCSNAYFINGMRELEKNNSQLKFFIFSDDIEDVKKNFDFEGRNVVFVEKNNPDYEELRLMYSCNHFIISNSTFSWWAANLSKRENKMIIAPKEWYTDHRDMSHIINKEWIILPN